MDLLSTTKTLLAQSPETQRIIAANSGVGYQWLAKFSQGRISDPGVSKVQQLHDYLSAKSQQAA